MLKRFARSRAPVMENEIQDMILLTLARAEENGNEFGVPDLAREMEMPRPLADAYVQNLLGQRLIQLERSKIRFSSAGRAHAISLLRRHRLTERLFTDVLGLSWAQAHSEADRFEHSLTAKAEQQLAAQLGNPETCPHGNPIPNAQSDAVALSSTPLAQCKLATRATITRIAEETPASLQHLATLGLLPDVEIEIENTAPFGGPVLIRVGRAHYALGRDLASRIWVRTS